MRQRTILGGHTVVILALVCMAGCPITEESAPQLELPEASRIPPGIYTGQMEVTVSDGQTEKSESLPFTIVIDENGRLLDVNGVPFVAGETYPIDLGLLTVENLAQSVTAFDYQIVLRFQIRATADLGDETAELSGSQRDTLSFDPDTGILRFLRLQAYGGRAPSGSTMTFLVQGEAELRSG